MEYGYAKYTAEDPDEELTNNQHIAKMQDEYLILSDIILNALNIVPLTAAPRATAQANVGETKGGKDQRRTET